MSWLDKIRALPAHCRFVQHEPETARYARARQKLSYLIDASQLVGTRPGARESALEVAAWAPPPDGRGPGYYSCFRVFRGGDGQVTAAVLFCFWDGTEASRGFRSFEAARSFATSDGFEEVDDGNQD